MNAITYLYPYPGLFKKVFHEDNNSEGLKQSSECWTDQQTDDMIEGQTV